MPRPRADRSAAVVNGRVYLLGGDCCESYPTDVYDVATDTWSQAAPMPTPRGELGVAVVDGIIYAISGWNSDVTEAFDPVTNTWSTLAPLSARRSQFGCVAVGGRIYAVGGYQASTSVYSSDPATNEWTQEPDMPGPNNWVNAVAVGSKILLAGGVAGVGGAALQACSYYDTVSKTWSQGPDLCEARSYASIVVANGKCILAGGLDANCVAKDTVYALTLDVTPPTTPVVTDDGATAPSPVELHAAWSSGDPDFEIVEYRYAIGTNPSDPGSGYIVDWKSAGTATEATETGLSLLPWQTYYWYVKARNGAGLWSEVGTSDGVLLEPTARVPFREDFDTLDSAVWMSYANGGNISLSDGKLSLSAAGSSLTFPYLHLKVNPFPSMGDFTMRIRMKFNSLGVFGTGLEATTTVPPNGPLAPDLDVTWWWWGDVARSPGIAYHDVEWHYSNGQVTESVDGVPSAAVETALPRCILLGNFWAVPGGYSWTSFEIDYIEVVPDDTTPPATPAVSDDGAVSASGSELHASWSSDDPESGIAEYQYAIGSSATDPGSGYFVGWKSAGTATEATEAGLALQANSIYYWYVKALNGAGEWSEVGVSDGIQYAPKVEWPVSQGGNGRLYQPVAVPGGVFWNAADVEARRAGGYLATITTETENLFVYGLVASNPAFWGPGQVASDFLGPWLGGWQPHGSDAGSGWNWVTGEEFSYTAWAESEPNDPADWQNRLHFLGKRTSAPNWTWSDVGQGLGLQDQHTILSYIIEYDPAWQQVYFSDFESGAGTEWSVQATDVTPGTAAHPADRFLGQLANQEVALALTSLPAHSKLQITFDLYVLKTWDGNTEPYGPELFEFGLAGQQPIVRTTFCNLPLTGPYHSQSYPGSYPSGLFNSNTGASETGTLGYDVSWGDLGRLDSVYRLRYVVDRSLDSDVFIFKVQGLESVDNESWGIDNIQVQVLTEVSPPTGPVVTDDGDITTEATQLHATWLSSDPESGIAEYQYAIGTTPADPGSGYLVGWKSAGTATEATETGLSLESGQTYYWYVKAMNGGGLWSEVGVSDGIKVAGQVVMTPGAAKLLPDGTAVGLLGARVTATSAVMSGRIYVEDPMRSSGIAALSSAAVAEGDVVSVAGVLATNSDGERVISDATVVVTGHEAPLAPVVTNLRCAASGPWFYQTASGLTVKGQRGVTDPPGEEMNTIGLLLQVHGVVMDMDGSFVFLNDGAWADRTGVRVLRANLPPEPTVGDYVRLTGISSMRKTSTAYQLVIRPRRSSDLEVIVPASEGLLQNSLWRALLKL